MEPELLQVNDLSTRFFTERGQINAVEQVSFNLKKGEIFGIVGESGSGKSVTAHSLMGIVESPGRITSGKIQYRSPELVDILKEDYASATDGEYIDIRELSDKFRRILRGGYFSMIFQDPQNSFNRTRTVGDQIAEAVEIKEEIDRNKAEALELNYGLTDYILDTLNPKGGYVSEESRNRAIELLELVGIPDPAQAMEKYPNEYSGGMLQRAMIAQALANDPDLLIADEPTTALDVTIQSQILDTLKDIQAKTDMGIILITHNLGVIARMSDRVGVMYAGELVEQAPLEDLFKNPVHPYTKGLLESSPSYIGGSSDLKPMPGSVPNLLDKEMGDKCYFVDRCPYSMDKCWEKPPDYEVEESHIAKCYLAMEDMHEVVDSDKKVEHDS